MAVDPALVGFDVVNQLQDTLLGYVMANRKMQQNDRQFNTQMQMQRDKLDEDIRRFDLGEDRLNRQEQQELNVMKSNRAIIQQQLDRQQAKKAIDAYDEFINTYNQSGAFGTEPRLLDFYAPTAEEFIGMPRPTLPEFKLPDFGGVLPTYGLDLVTNQNTTRGNLMNLMLQDLRR
tara:strand:+ start:136 stop:660 length:525 start_codon:yes stop_codon:yes gene_type:complete